MTSEDIYHRPDHLRPYPDLPESTPITRPIVTYSNDLRPYDSSLINSSSHRPYDPGTATAFERYDPGSGACAALQQGFGPQRAPGQPMYPYGPLEEEQRYQQEASMQHQMVTTGMMKSEHGEQENTGPLYPRYALFYYF